ncbi:hypothetical protein DPMN_141224 [Dreissena polymorpha]|uniref:Secreted protein n=1 Tax=Dreissena polymorpha TaxID=45954 RepID=A0A9D4G925_DREPO|nr:hypothetical protein DPMN_141224 [Dreissena polymorpha]
MSTLREPLLLLHWLTVDILGFHVHSPRTVTFAALANRGHTRIPCPLSENRYFCCTGHVHSPRTVTSVALVMSTRREPLLLLHWSYPLSENRYFCCMSTLREPFLLLHWLTVDILGFHVHSPRTVTSVALVNR